MKEFWKTVDGFSNHEVSTLGRVRNVHTGYFLNPALNTSGVRFVRVRPDDPTQKVYNYCVHHMVIETFLGAPPFEGMEVSHLDDDHENNALTNLAYETHTSNMRRRHLNGKPTRVTDELTESEVSRLADAGLSTHAIKTRLGLSRSTAARLCGDRKSFIAKKLDADKVKTIRVRLAAGDKAPTIARDYGVTPPTIYLIRDNKIWAQQ